MCRAVAAHHEVVHGAHDAFAKETRPHVIDRDASRQRIVAADEPAGEVETVGHFTLAWLYRGQCRKGSRYDGVLRREEIAAMQQLGGARVDGALADDPHIHER